MLMSVQAPGGRGWRDGRTSQKEQAEGFFLALFQAGVEFPNLLPRALMGLTPILLERCSQPCEHVLID